MSTTTLLILSARLRDHGRAHPVERSVRSAIPDGPGRAFMMGVHMQSAQFLALFRHGRAGTGPSFDALPGRTVWRAGSGADLVSRIRPGSPGFALAIACAIDPLRFRRSRAGAIPPVFTLCRRGKRQAGAGLAILPQYARAGLLGLACFVLTTGHALAQETAAGDTAPTTTLPSTREDAERETRIGGGPPPSPCVVVDIAGHRAGHLECASQTLEEAARIARKAAEAAREISIPEAGSPDVQVGVASRSATRLRLRENFGVSIRPPAVAPPVFTPPTGPRP